MDGDHISKAAKDYIWILLVPLFSSSEKDGLFGQCQESSQQDRPYFQVTAPVLQRLQDVLRHLMAQGLSWQDDLTQYVISREMERIPKLHLPHSWESVAENRLPSMHPAPRRSSLLSEPASLQEVHQPPLPPALLQRYLELLLASQPELGYKDTYLSSYPHHQVYSPSIHNPEPAILLDRAAASKALFGASTAPSYRGQQGLDGGQLFQDLGALYLTQEQAGKSRPRGQHRQGSRNNGVLQDYGESSEAGGESQIHLEDPDRAVQRLMAVFASYGIRPQDMIRLLQYPGVDQLLSPQATEAEMQHGGKLEPPPSQGSHVSAIPTEGQIQAQGETIGPTEARTAVTTASPENPEPLYPAKGDASGPKGQVVVKKSHTTYRESSREEDQSETGLAAEEYGYIITDQKPLGLAAGIRLLEILAEHVHLSTASFINIRQVAENVVGPALTFRIRQNHQNLSLGDVANRAALVKPQLETEVGVKILQMGVGQRNEAATYPHPTHFGDTFRSVLLTFVLLACVAGVVIAAAVVFCLRQHAKQREKERLAGLGPEGAADSTFEYQAYMEDHLRNRDRLAKEWQALCAYQAEPNACDAAHCEANVKKNRNPDYVPYDHARIKLKAESNPSRSDFINASPIIDHDPRMPAYLATQGPLSHTIADFWQVNLVSEHIWCEDFLVRSFYLKNVQSQETRTLTQFHFLSWPAEGIPTTTRPLLDFRRKVNKCYRGRSCPIVVHCSDGAGRTGTYILIDMVLNRMAKGVKEIDIAATLEHVRDQRPGMVQTKDQFEFALTAVAEEVNAILKALPQ
ncbi:hypothetical protein JD844_022279 [Phrynosoma platyrhinos]|uniref:Receptor-type tyrosine-protein phosphatase-like N n=1 Tax=Phrynosoma platyrhinos TaxID=52577 RepID=A0ABQ7SUU8_PHRPL|nr:hypothetical protein JD844_022279 [Phrynosoma platyrhinos]